MGNQLNSKINPAIVTIFILKSSVKNGSKLVEETHDKSRTVTAELKVVSSTFFEPQLLQKFIFKKYSARP